MAGHRSRAIWAPEALDDIDRIVSQPRAAAGEQDIGAHFDFNPEVTAPDGHHVFSDELIHRVRDFIRKAGQRRRGRRSLRGQLADAGCVSSWLGHPDCNRHWSQVCLGPAVQHGLLNDGRLHVRAGTHLLVAHLDGLHAAWRSPECGKQRIRQHPVLAGVDG